MSVAPDAAGAGPSPRPSRSGRVDVVVVGCGPVGVMGALRCAQRGLSVVAVDRSEEIYPLPRAVGMDAEMQWLFHRAGLGDRLGRHSTPLPGAEFVDRSGARVVGMEAPDGAVGALGFPRMITFDQPGVEGFLREAAAAAGVELRLGVEVVSVSDTDGGVRVGLDGGGRAGSDPATAPLDRGIEARWLLAADGAKSTIRPWRRISLVDQGFDQTWLVVDTTLLDPDLPLPRLARQICDPARMCTFVPGPGAHRRWEFRLHPDETREAMLDEEAIRRLLAPWGTDDQLRIDRAAVYRFHATVAETFRDGPVFLAGDAAHQMPPFNGQGMCTGLRDVENLSWKLAMVASGQAGDALLDTYDEERRPHAAGQVAHSVDAGLLIEAIATDGDAALESGYGQRPFPRLEGRLFVGDHDRIGHPLRAPAVELGPLPDGWVLLRGPGAGPVPDLWARLGATVIDVPAGAFPGLVDGGVTAVVRPDRYVAAVGPDLAPATAVIERVLAPSAS